MHKKLIFYDHTGRRKKFIAIILVIILALLSIGLYVTVKRLSDVHTIALNGSDVTKASINHQEGSLFYTENNPDSQSVFRDNIDELNYLFIPRYLYVNGAVSTPQSYRNLYDNLLGISGNKDLVGKTHFVLSGVDYSLMRSERVDQQLNNDVANTILNSNTINLLIRDILQSKNEGIMLDFEINDYANPELESFIINFNNKLKINNLKLGISVNLKNITPNSTKFFDNFDYIYIRGSNNSKLKDKAEVLKQITATNKPIIFELTTDTTRVRKKIEGPYVENISYASVEALLLNQKLSRDEFFKILLEDNTYNYQVADSVTSYNQMVSINNLGVSSNNVSFAVSDPGYEEASVWNIIKSPQEILKNKQLLAKRSYATNKPFEYGSGEIFELIKDRSPAARELYVDEDSKMIKSSKLIKPSKRAVVKRTGNIKNRVAITFDDGPHPVYTNQILDILDQYGAKGTFFATGENVLRNIDTAREIIKRGHALESHSFSHPAMSSITDKSQINQIESTTELFFKVTGQKPKYFRSPFSTFSVVSSYVDVEYLNFLKQYNLKANEYDIDSKDWEENSSQKIVENLKNKIESNSGQVTQILLHDATPSSNYTVEALPRILEYLQSKGFEVVTVGELDNPKTVNSVGQHSMPSDIYLAFIIKKYIIYFIAALSLIVMLAASFKYFWIFVSVVIFLSTKSIQKIHHKTYYNQLKKAKRYPELCVIIACYNEEKVIADTIQSLIDCKYPKLKIIVVDDGSKDNTHKIVTTLKNKYGFIQLIRIPNQGKSKALMRGIADADKEWLVFCDADTHFESDALHQLARTIVVNKRVDAVAGKIFVGNQINFLTKAQAIEYGIAQLFIKPSQHIYNSITVVPGAIGAWRKESLRRIDFFSDETLAEDTDATISLISLGSKVVYNQDIQAKTEAPISFSMLSKQRLRWQLGNMQVVFKHGKGFLNKKYGMLGFVGIPMLYAEIVSSIIFVIILPYLIFSFFDNHFSLGILSGGLNIVSHQIMTKAGIVVIVCELALAVMASLLEKTSIANKIKLLMTVPYYITVYKGFISYISVRALWRALRGTPQGWGHLNRTATIKSNIT